MASHGHSYPKSPTYLTWQCMKRRCLDPRHMKYAEYGAKGVTVCESWLKFENFLADMGTRPEGKTLDRIEASKGYEPGNCRWATYVEQTRNRKNTLRFTLGNKTLSLMEWATFLDIPYCTLKERIRRQKLSFIEAITYSRTKESNQLCLV